MKWELLAALALSFFSSSCAMRVFKVQVIETKHLGKEEKARFVSALLSGEKPENLKTARFDIPLRSDGTFSLQQTKPLSYAVEYSKSGQPMRHASQEMGTVIAGSIRESAAAPVIDLSFSQIKHLGFVQYLKYGPQVLQPVFKKHAFHTSWVNSSPDWRIVSAPGKDGGSLFVLAQLK